MLQHVTEQTALPVQLTHPAWPARLLWAALLAVPSTEAIRKPRRLTAIQLWADQLTKLLFPPRQASLNPLK
jgi:hypothetical protein